MPRPITERMAEAITDLNTRWKGQRRPKAFYLVPADWDEFTDTDPPTIRTMVGNNPPTEVEDPAFRGVPVRVSKGKVSKVYDNTATGRVLPK